MTILNAQDHVSGYRLPDSIMTLSRMGSFHQNRLSFMRTLIRRVKDEKWIFERPRFEINSNGVGVAIYSAKAPHNTYSLVAFSHDLPTEMRSDRVIATEWDATFTLFDGEPSGLDIERLHKNVPLQESGRLKETELSLSRANRSVRLWDHVVNSLSEGLQPDIELVRKVGYLMRTTAVYGSGKFGVADRELTSMRSEFREPFQVEMLTVYLIRTFVMDLVEHLAKMKSPKAAVKINSDLRRRFGIGNSTGLGMAPFLINHPMLINNWILAKEEALSRVRNVEFPSEAEVKSFKNLLPRVMQSTNDWNTAHPLQLIKLANLKNDLLILSKHIEEVDFSMSYPWSKLYLWSEKNLSLEGQEQLVSMLLEPYSDLVDGLSHWMDADEAKAFRISGNMLISNLKALCEDIYSWALNIDWSQKGANARAWYVSEEKLEPRLGERFSEDIEDYEQPLQPGRDVSRMYHDLKKFRDEQTIAFFLMEKPEHRHTVRRCQLISKYQFGEIRDNTIDAKMMPIDLLRAKLSFFGATHFDPRSDRWLRINMFRGAPFPNELKEGFCDDWAYPIVDHS